MSYLKEQAREGFMDGWNSFWYPFRLIAKLFKAVTSHIHHSGKRGSELHSK